MCLVFLKVEFCEADSLWPFFMKQSRFTNHFKPIPKPYLSCKAFKINATIFCTHTHTVITVNNGSEEWMFLLSEGSLIRGVIIGAGTGARVITHPCDLHKECAVLGGGFCDDKQGACWRWSLLSAGVTSVTILSLSVRSTKLWDFNHLGSWLIDDMRWMKGEEG